MGVWYLSPLCSALKNGWWGCWYRVGLCAGCVDYLLHIHLIYWVLLFGQYDDWPFSSFVRNANCILLSVSSCYFARFGVHLYFLLPFRWAMATLIQTRPFRIFTLINLFQYNLMYKRVQPLITCGDIVMCSQLSRWIVTDCVLLCS